MVDWGALTAPCRDVFGEPVTYQPAAGGAYAISAIFDNAYREITLSDNGPPVTSVYPLLGVLLSDLPVAPQQGDQVVVASTGKTYAVREVRPDSHGWAQLPLNRVT